MITCVRRREARIFTTATVFRLMFANMCVENVKRLFTLTSCTAIAIPVITERCPHNMAKPLVSPLGRSVLHQSIKLDNSVYNSCLGTETEVDATAIAYVNLSILYYIWFVLQRNTLRSTHQLGEMQIAIGKIRIGVVCGALRMKIDV